ncbi:hypothetical protein BOTBODRAFT_44912 [Botryobasidium botryosum FD-172 SS1]|uniref:Uncharacterized protein n=1 Tax=Botryobasidium botryosum (strain FD-172 SS1) TaxID=930990 RepID=A0A067ME10_BOTB1|nr:hypothetical protein BOTBODRAFT_44912 [Botryobasidium botryosum FD-172 SS1]
MTRDKQKRETLDVEDDEERQMRIERLLASQAQSIAGNSNGVQNAPVLPPFPALLSERRTYAIGPPIDLLARLESFLPEMERANAELQRQAEADPSSVEIEILSGEEDEEEDGDEDEGEEVPRGRQLIEMNLGLGVFEQRNKRIASDGTSSSGSSSSSDTDSSDKDDSSDEAGESSIPAHGDADLLSHLLGSRGRQKPNIVMLDEDDPMQNNSSISKN